jgi:integrase
VRRAERHAAPVDIPDDALGVVVAALEPRERALVLFCRFLGVRPAEAYGVRAWGNATDFLRAPDGRPLVRIARQRKVTHQRGGDPWTCGPLKAGEPQRTLPIPPALWAELEPLLAAGRPRVRRGHGGGWREEVDFLFPFTNATQVRELNRKLQATGVVPKGRGLYTARHAWMRGQGEARVHPQVTRKASGHAWISTVQGYYDRAGFRPSVDPETMAASAPKGWPGAPAPPKAKGADAAATASAPLKPLADPTGPDSQDSNLGLKSRDGR